MNFQRAFLLSSYLLFLAGAGALWMAGGVTNGAAAVYLILVILSAVVTPRGLSTWKQVLLLVALALCYLADVFFLSDFVLGSVHFLLLISLYKLFTRSSDRDFLLLYFLSFALLLVSTTYFLSVFFLVWMILYLFLAILTFILFENRSAFRRAQMAPFQLRGFVGMALGMTGLAVLLAIPIFLAIPRGSLGFFGGQGPAFSQLSGFSNRVQLGDIGRILTNPKIVMRISLEREKKEEAPFDLKWRGVALDHYDGRVWRNTRASLQRTYHRSSDHAFHLNEGLGRYHFSLRQSVSFLEPFSNVVFGARDIVQMWGGNLSGQAVIRDGNGNYTVSQSGRTPLRYTLDSVFSPRSELVRSARETHSGEPADPAYLQLPPLDPRIPALARSVTHRFVNPVDKALALEAFLKNTLGYSLDNAAAGSADPLSSFLFAEKAGHCEFFAAAQAVMMRSLGVPARVVNGFQRGEFSEWGNYFIVRQSDAHSWVEGYFPGVGWIDFDPTPRARAEVSAGFSAGMSRLLDALDLFWTELVTFDRFKQISFFQQLGLTVSSNWSRLHEGLRESVQMPGVEWRSGWGFLKSRWRAAVTALLILGLGWMAYRFRRYFRLAWRRHVLKQEGAKLAPEYYQEMLSVLAGKGLRRAASETPLEFGRRAEAALQSRLPGKITELYYRHRFGDVPLTSPELSWIYAGLRQLRKGGRMKDEGEGRPDRPSFPSERKGMRWQGR